MDSTTHAHRGNKTIWRHLIMSMASSKHVPQVRSGRCADGSVPAPPFDLCVAHTERCSFRDATGILRRNNLPTIISTFHVSELWLLTLFHPALLFHCYHCWAKIAKNSCVLFLNCFTWYCLYFSVMFCYNCSQFVVQFIVAFLLNFSCSKTVMKAIEQGSSRTISPVQNSVQESVHSPVHSPVQSPGFTLT